MKNKIRFLGVVLIVFLLISACTRQEYQKNVELETVLNDIEKITAEQLTIEESEEGISYTFKVVNNSPYSIKQNVVYFSYPIIIANGTKGNPFKAEATGK